ncbi:Predicted Fe2+/Mn2+ transporter, VIT1/CCC1 family [Collimonas sp. OK307]|uniref:VIT1/CCC1 transporter family protein n=1 Tax=Collimonas sp. OK307 TaxID=1801620 RepID=UPI0008E5EFF7|nr:VIT family protein [Collimonas sp. OK307]SFI36223.1 Predicted Fe2+/Mn2+ transporter, VIT1/CCC1 family [Collimonas sp. OK307]
MIAHIHRTHRSGWLRASVLGANDGVLSISSLLLGVAAAHMNPEGILVAGFAGLVAGALSMGAGEFVSVSSQADTERADLDIERRALLQDYDAEHAELRDIYIQRGLDPELASKVAQQLMEHDAIGAHARDDIGITEALTARPMQAAISSSLSFVLGGAVPMLAAVLAPAVSFIPTIAVVSLIFLGALGAFAAYAGGAPIMRGAARVLALGLLAMGVTGVVGAFFGGGA